MVPRARPRPGSDRSIGLTVSAIGLTGVLGNAMIAPALPDIARALDVGNGGIGLVVAAASLPGVLVAPIIGVASDRLGRRAVVIPCLGVFGLGGLIAMLAPSFGVLLAARLLQGFGAAGLVNLAVVIIGDRHDDPLARAAAIGRNGAVLTVGLAVLPGIGGLLVSLGGWRASFAPYAASFLVAGAAARVLPAGRPETHVGLAEQMREGGRLLRDVRVAAMTSIGFGVFVLMFGIVLTALPIDLDERFGSGPALRGLILGLPAAASIGVSLAMGRLMRRWAAWDLVVAGLGIFTVAFLAVAAAPTVAVVGAAMGFYGLGEGLAVVPLQAYAASLAPAAHRGMMVAVWVSAVRGGQAAGPVLAGACLSLAGSRAAFVAGAGVAALLAGAVLVIRGRITLEAREP